MRIVELSAHDALKLYPHMQGYVEEALAHDPVNSTTYNDLGHQIATGFAIMLITTDSEGDVAGCTICQRLLLGNGERCLHVVITAGSEFELWIHPLRDKLNELGQQHRCQKVTLIGRPGWTRMLRPVGFHVEQVTMSMEVTKDVHGEVRAV